MNQGLHRWRHVARHTRWCVGLLALSSLGHGCAPAPLYDWGPYESSLRATYVTHDEGKAWSDLEASIAGAGRSGRRLPPGLCAEFGFMLYKRGRREEAITYFEREAQLYPEARPLMEKLIAKLGDRSIPATETRRDGQP